MLNDRRIGVVVECAVCGRMKKPIGRSQPLGALYCADECDGYRLAPFAGSLWPGESEATFGFSVGVDGTTDAVDPHADSNTGNPSTRDEKALSS